MSRAYQIMLVEDDALLAMDVTAALSDAGHDVLGPFGTVQAAMKAAGINRLDAAILDVDLGREMSFPVADALASANVPFLWLSGSSPDLLPARHRGRPFLGKPLVPARLLATLAGLLKKP